MLEQIKKYISENELCEADERVLIAFSSGRDSVCLAHLLIEAGYDVALAHVNYGLRGVDSEADEAFARQFAADRKLDIHVHNEPFEKGENLQERARNVRYGFFQKLCVEHNYSSLATAHHRSDNLETFLVQLLRGASLRALGGIPPKNGNIIRPLLFADRSAIDAYLQANKLAFREDASNATLDYLRNRVRHQMLPAIEDVETNALRNLESISARLAEHTLATKAFAQSFWESTDRKAILLDRLPKSMQAFWLHEAVYDLGFTRTQCENAVSAKQSGKEVASQQWRMVLNGNRIEIAAKSNTKPSVAELNNAETIENNHYKVTASQTNKLLRDPANLQVVLDAEKIDFPIQFRPWKPGDSFQPLGSSYHVKIKDYLTDKKLGKLRKEQTVVACSGGKIIWIPGIAISDKVKVTNDSSSLVCLDFCYIRE